MVGGDEDVGVEGHQAGEELTDAFVDDLDGAGGGLKVAGVADHVAVGVVDDDEAVGIVLQALEQLVGDVVGLHLRVRGEGGRVEAAGHLHLILAGIGLGALAVEKAGDVAELLRLGQAELADAGLGDDLAQEHVHGAVAAHRAKKVILELVPIAGEAQVGDLGAAGTHAGVVVADKGLGQLDGAILAIVGVHHAVAILDARVIADDGAGDVLVGHRVAVRRLLRVIGRLHGLLDGGETLALGIDQALEGLGGQRPVLGTIHRVIPAHRRADDAAADLGHHALKLGQILERRARGRVAAVQEGMDDDAALGELLAGAAHDLEEMLLVGVDALILQQAHQMKLGLVRLPIGDQRLPLRALEQLPALQAVVDALELLLHDAARAHVQVAHLGRALVTIGQTHLLARALNAAPRVTRAQTVDHGGLGAEDGVAGETGIHPPTVADDQADRAFVHGRIPFLNSPLIIPHPRPKNPPPHFCPIVSGKSFKG